ncbi:unnamed protein product [Chironomus riparius]|uniref:Uncharacterized protein n=1 Tax=Chironomus riparius TaxID=315576 RepID=A0A9N9RSL9_9DIPT|nr:unnamed protein product [Chironomus riparius]
MDDFSDWSATSLPKEEKPVKQFTGFSFCKRRLAHFYDRLSVDQQNPQYLYANNQELSIEDQLIDAQNQYLSNQSEKSHHKHWHHKYWSKKCNKGKNEAVKEPAKESN